MDEVIVLCFVQGALLGSAFAGAAYSGRASSSISRLLGYVCACVGLLSAIGLFMTASHATSVQNSVVATLMGFVLFLALPDLLHPLLRKRSTKANRDF